MEEKTKPLKILVIEDDSDNLNFAKESTQSEFIQGIFNRPISVNFSQDYKTAETLIEQGGTDGIITDLLFPYDIKNLESKELGDGVLDRIREEFAKKSGDDRFIPEFFDGFFWEHTTLDKLGGGIAHTGLAWFVK